MIKSVKKTHCDQKDIYVYILCWLTDTVFVIVYQRNGKFSIPLAFDVGYNEALVC